MLEPFVSDDALVEDIQQARKQRNALHVWWLGQSGFLLRYNVWRCCLIRICLIPCRSNMLRVTILMCA